MNHPGTDFMPVAPDPVHSHQCPGALGLIDHDPHHWTHDGTLSNCAGNYLKPCPVLNGNGERHTGRQA
jgi:hypothetical protein